MKDNSLDGHRGKVALSDTSRNVASNNSNNTCSNNSIVKSVTSNSTASTAANDGSTATNFDDDYNEWELGIGDLIIDLDADIEKTNERNGTSAQQGIHSHHNGTTAPSPSSAVSESPTSTTAFSFLGPQANCGGGNLAATAMSNSKSPRLSENSGVGTGSANSGSGASASGNGSGSANTFEHQATVDKGLKMKIKRKNVGSKYSEAKHEIVQSDTKSSGSTSYSLSDGANTTNNSNNSASNVAANSPANSSDTPKSKHSSSKGRNSSHREKKEKNRDKDKNSSSRINAPSTPSSEVNGVLGVMSPLKITNSGVSLSSPAPPSLCSNSSPLPASSVNTSSVSSVANSPASNNSGQDSVQAGAVGGSLLSIPMQTTSASSSPPMPNLTLKLEAKFTASPISQPSVGTAVVIKQEDEPMSPPQKKIKLEPVDRNGEIEDMCSSPAPEMKDASTCISVGTITEPDCLGPCEPGTSVMLEGIVWQETEGGVLVVNVTWRGKTYVGTLLDCTKHDWAPPRFCESPTSDVDSKTSKGRGKRGRGGNNSSSDISSFDARNCIQSKLRNGKGRRTTINSNASSSGFTVPNSPAKSDSSCGNSKRKGRPSDLELSTPPSDSKSSKRNRSQNRATPTSSASSTEFSQPSSPVLIVCPEPNCSKKYKHINGLRYHQTHAHSASDSSKLDDTATEDSKDVTNSSDNEESMQESASVSTSPAPTFANSVPPHSNTKLLLNETVSSSSSNLNSLPESDPFNLTTDLSTLASVAISDSKSGQNASNIPRTIPVALHSTVPQELPIGNSEGDNLVPGLAVSLSSPSPNPVSVSSPMLSASPPTGNAVLPAAVSAVTTSVIQSSNSVDSIPISQAVTVSIPSTHVIFNQGISGSNNTNVCYTTSTVVCNSSNPLSPRNISSANVTTTFAQVSSIVSASATSPSSMLPLIDKSKIKQERPERPDKYKPKSPMSVSSIRPVVPASPQLMALSPNVPPHSVMEINNHNIVGNPLKPVQPKPNILGEPVNSVLDPLKKDKSKHKKKSKDKDKERDKKISLPLTPSKLGMNSSEECEAMELTSYPSLEAVSGSAGPLPGATHSTLSPLVPQSKPPDSSLDMGLPDDTINENIQSPAYSDISDANDTAPVLESEVPSVKEKEDKVGKTTPDASQSPAANISAYGMYPYYSQPPYLLPSVSPQSAVSVSQVPSLGEKNDVKKAEQERMKENRPWSNPNGESRERPHMEHHEVEKKVNRDDNVQNPGAISSPAVGSGPVQDYSLPQHYPYSYSYVQGYPYPLEPSSYHMHMLENDPHYKQQYKQYIEEQQRFFKEQQQQQHHQQQQQHMQQQLQHHHQQQQQQQQQQPPPPSHHSHQSHHSQHQSHHQSKSQHHASVKEDRDRSRESKERVSTLEKMPNSSLIVEHSSKIQHSSMPLVPNKDHDLREIDTRPPSLPAQTRIESSAPSSASAAALKEKQNENHQILKENIELKSQMDDSKNKINQYEMAMIFERHREDMRRFYMYQDRVIEQQQQKMEPGIHHHTHLHQTIQSHSHMQSASASYSSSSSLKTHKEDLSSSLSSHSKSAHYGDSTRSSVVSPAKSDHIKSSHSNNTSSPKGSIRDSSLSNSKEYLSSSRDSSASKKESQSKSSESSGREEKKIDKIKSESKVESEGQKPTMETTGPPPPPTNSYAYLHPSYLQGPPHFPHMPFEPAHAMYRGGINPMIVSTPHYGSSPYVHPQIRYVPPGACELPAHSQPPDALSSKLHPSGPPKALDLLHQVSQHYTTTHKIHELQEHALMSPTQTSTPSSTPSTVSSSGSGKSSSEPVVVSSKMEGPRDTSRSPPTQRHIHQHHHTHVGVGYPIYDPYGAIIPSPSPTVDCKPIHPLQVKPSAAGARFWP